MAAALLKGSKTTLGLCSCFTSWKLYKHCHDLCLYPTEQPPELLLGALDAVQPEPYKLCHSSGSGRRDLCPGPPSAQANIPALSCAHRAWEANRTHVTRPLKGHSKFLTGSFLLLFTASGPIPSLLDSSLPSDPARGDVQQPLCPNSHSVQRGRDCGCQRCTASMPARATHSHTSVKSGTTTAMSAWGCHHHEPPVPMEACALPKPTALGGPQHTALRGKGIMGDICLL